MTESIFFRVLTAPVEEKGQMLEAMIGCLNEKRGEEHDSIWMVDLDTFSLAEGTPFAYWLSKEILAKLSKFPPFEPTAGIVRVGLQTSDDPRFVRAIWEVRPEDLYFCYYPSTESNFCRFDDPIVEGFRKRRNAGKMKWAFHVKGGSSQPWYSPLTMVVNWERDGLELRNFRDEKGKLRSVLRNLDYYFRPGFSWTRRAVRLVPYIVPRNAIPTVSRYQAFPDSDKELMAIGVAASNLATGFCRIYGEMFERPNFLVSMIKALPWSQHLGELKQQFNDLASREVNRRRQVYSYIEPFQEFVFPSWVAGKQNTYLDDLTYNPRALLSRELDLAVAVAYGLNENQLEQVERDVLEAIEFQQSRSARDDEEEDDEDHLVFAYSERDEIEAVLQYAVGCAFGRWDVRMALDPALAPEPAGPFDPMPVCPPGTLITTNGLPASRGTIVSEEWLRSRPSAITLPPEGTVSSPTIPDSKYPLPIAWDGILVDDHSHPSDIVKRVRSVLKVIWDAQSGQVEQEALQILGYDNLHQYFRDARRGFFDFHIGRYTEGRRKAPIYWLLQSENGNYALWLYYHRIGPNTYLDASRNYVDVKIEMEKQRLNELHSGLEGLQGSVRKQREREIARQQRLVDEVITFGKTLDEIALKKLPPDPNDGVVLSIAPLHPLVPWKEAEKEWRKLLKGQYPWSTMHQQMKTRGII